jgi:hypothetical protein
VITTQNSNQGGNSARNSSNPPDKTSATGNSATSTKGSSQRNQKPTHTKIDDTIIQERDQLIKYMKQYIKKNNELPPTTLNFYKFVKMIGKGAFGKVTLGIHKLTGK